ncbi:TolC family outer membrane protein [Amphiplicatus metriothermophilus]|uniref:Outer membrane protein n=1 Tax=Amphiplicatus metriothermophilus TaxID=1519374 RepID=A0A239PXV8_9PROT|nr:TolC family outer membrane protein [Amphiplicatus metriothermophilus]MBB5519889.1 outer membrane protein [Amphiplicatus metriothermophilus]SNT74792.1 outer membrane protein [Amphiplicatus metriothermophilus]
MNAKASGARAMGGAAVLALGAIFIPGGAGAQSLEEALALAYRANPTIRAERARLRATQELKAQARAGALPQISAQGSYSRIDETQTINQAAFGGTGAAARTFKLDTLSGQVTAEQPVFTGFRNLNAIRQAKARIRAGGAQLAATEQAVLRAVATAYFDVLRDRVVYDASRNQVEVLLRQLDETQARFRVGEVTRTDVSQAEARLARARADLASAQAQLAVSRASFAELVGQAPGELEDDPETPDLPESLDAAKALARSYAPAVVAAREQAEASRRQVAIARGALLPSVSLTASYQYAEEPSTFVLDDEQFVYGARASVPIFQGGLNHSRVREARALADSAREAVVEAERRAEAAVAAAWERLVAARIAIAAAEKQVAANRLALDGVRREAQLGTRTTLDVLDAEQELRDAVVALAGARRDERAAAFALLEAAGILTLDANGADAAAVVPADGDE